MDYTVNVNLREEDSYNIYKICFEHQGFVKKKELSRLLVFASFSRLMVIMVGWGGYIGERVGALGEKSRILF